MTYPIVMLLLYISSNCQHIALIKFHYLTVLCIPDYIPEKLGYITERVYKGQALGSGGSWVRTAV